MADPSDFELAVDDFSATETELEDVESEELDFLDAEDSPQRGCFGYVFTTKKKRLRFGFLDAIDISTRYTLAVGLALAFIVFVDTDTLQSQFPGYSMLAINAGFIMEVCYTGITFSEALSWCFGSYFGVILSYISVLILDTDTHEETIEVVAECDGAVQFQTGPVGDPSPVVIGIFIFIVNFCLSYYSHSASWSVGASLGYNVYVLAWFRSVKTPTASKLGFIDFSLLARTSCIGVLWGALFTLIPFFRWNARPRGVPLPRFASSRATMLLNYAGEELHALSASLSSEYQSDNVFRIKEETFNQKQVIITYALKHIREARKLLDDSVRWEPLFTTKPYRFDQLLEYADLLEQLAIQLNSIVVLYKEKLKRHTPNQKRFEPMQDEELFVIMNNLTGLMGSVFDTIIKKGKGYLEISESLNEEMEHMRAKVVDLFEGIEIPEGWHPISEEQAFHCNCIWKFHNVCKIVVRINEIFYKPHGKLYHERLMDWGIFYFKDWYSSAKDTIKKIFIKRKFQRFAYDRYDPFFGSIQIGISAIVASLFTLIPHLRVNAPNSITILTTATLVMSRDNPTLQYSRSFHRLTGTALAVGAAFLIFVIFPEGNTTGTMIFVIIYAFISRFIECHSTSPYIYETFTIALLTVLYDVSPVPQILDVNIATNRRAAATTLGVVIACLASILWPIQSRALLRTRLAKVMHSNFIPLLQVIFSDTDGTIDSKKLEDRLKKAIKSITKQNNLVDYAAAEPAILSDKFVPAPFKQIISIENRLLVDLFSTIEMNRTLCELTRSKKEANIIFSEKTTTFSKLVTSRMSNIIRAIETNTYVPLQKQNLSEEYYNWVSDLVKRISKENVRAEVKLSLWAYIMNCSFVIEDLVKLRNATDQLKEHIRLTKEDGFTIGRFPLIVPAKRKVKQANFFNEEEDDDF